MFSTSVNETQGKPIQGDQVDYFRPVITPARKACIMVLQQAVEDIRTHRMTRKSETMFSDSVREEARATQRAYLFAHLWVASEDRTQVFSFENICDTLGIDIEAARRGLGVSRKDSFFGVKTLPFLAQPA